MADETTLGSELKDQEQLLARVLKTGDADALAQVLAPDYLVTTAQGEMWGRDRAIADVRDPAFSVGHIAVEVDGVVAWGDVGVVVGRSKVQGQIGARPLSGGFRFTHVWRRRTGRWQIVASHTSRAAEPVASEGHPATLPNNALHPTGGSAIAGAGG